MVAHNDALWHQLCTFRIGSEADKLSFSDRLARENGWSSAFAAECVTEYRRFLYLAAIAGHPVTPSEAVDQVWHLHLTYTRSYWHDLCRDLLGRELHHDPTTGGEAEAAKYQSQYARTLALYEETFREPPSNTIWPSPEERFSAANHFVRINRADTWLVRKPRPWLAVLLLPLFLAACTQEGESEVWFYFKIAVAGYVLFRVLRWLDSGGGGGGGSGCSAGGCGSGCGGGGC